jgi:hypothetical protein
MSVLNDSLNMLLTWIIAGISTLFCKINYFTQLTILSFEFVIKSIINTSSFARLDLKHLQNSQKLKFKNSTWKKHPSKD